jgi:hypothetical protein
MPRNYNKINSRIFEWSYWTACRQFKECLAGAEQFGKYVVDFEYFLIDVNRYLAKELLGFENPCFFIFH